MPMPKSVYVAASFEQREVVQSFYKRLKEHGHTITADWTVWYTFRFGLESPQE